MQLKQHAIQLALSGGLMSSSPPTASTPSVSSSISNAQPTPGYSLDTPTTIRDPSFTFGQHYAVLNLDLIDGLVSSFNDTDEGEKWIDNVANWIDAVHAKKSQPLTIYTRLYFSTPWRPEVSPSTPFAKAISSLGNITESSPESQIYHGFTPKRDVDVVLRKGRYYAGDGNSLEEILRTWGVDTVILSGVRTSGVMLSTVFRLFDLNYKVYVIANNTIETSSNAQVVNDAILQGILPKMPVDVITIEQAIGALKRSA